MSWALQPTQQSARLYGPVGTGFAFDVVLAESTSLPSDITDHPVEIGSPIVDHVQLRPITINVTGTVSNTPIGSRGGSGRAVASVQELRALRDSEQLLTLALGDGSIYDNMLIASITVSRDNARGRNTRDINLGLKQVRLVYSTFTVIDPALLEESAQPSAAPETETTQTDEKEDKEITELDTSFLRRLEQATTGTPIAEDD
jgi:hypothetical protein